MRDLTRWKLLAAVGWVAYFITIGQAMYYAMQQCSEILGMVGTLGTIGGNIW